MTAVPIPDIVVGRLPRYLQTLEQLSREGNQKTSSQELGKKIGISAAQIRKDFSHFGEFGKQGTGYFIPFLIERLRLILKLNQVWNIALIGGGNLGHAIAQYQGFANSGFKISLVFDNDPAKIGTMIGNFMIYDTAEMVPMIKDAGIKVVMLTVPASTAQELAETLVKTGIRAILNYSPVVLNLPEDIQVEYIDPVIQLQHMSFYL
jgi:redox-sensing transcriptional repressor